MDETARGKLEGGEARLAHIARRAAAADEIAVLRGHEGEAALAYFGAFDSMGQGDRLAFSFHGRSRRPPLDRVQRAEARDDQWQGRAQQTDLGACLHPR